MDGAEPVGVTVDARGVAVVTLHRAHKRNAMDAAMIAALTAAAARLGADPAVCVVVLAADGPVFCAGGDLRWMRAQMAAEPDRQAAQARGLSDMLGAWDALPHPVIGRIGGDAFGGGVGLACVCDLAIGVDDARFGLTEVRLGLIPATIAPYVLARTGARAREVMLSGRIFDAAEAVRLGILARAVPAGGLDAEVASEVALHLAAAPGAAAAAKALVRALGQAPTPDAVARSIDALVARWEDPEARARVAAFFARRAPDG